jgi:hypothetical protein
MEDKLNWLAYRSGILTEQFQRRHLLVNYSILALALVLYGVGLVGVLAITLACLPGAAVFIVSVEALFWKKAVEQQDMFDLIRTMWTQR